MHPELVLFTGHSADVTSLTFSPDGLILASGSYDRSIILWDIHSGEMLRRISGLDEGLDRIIFSPDGKAIASDDSESVKLWNPHDGSLISTLKPLSRAFAFTPEGHLLAETHHGKLVIWDVQRQKIIQRLEHRFEFLESADLSADGSMLAITDLGSIQILNAATGQVLHTLTVSKEQLEKEKLGALDIEEVVFSPDGHTIAAVCFMVVRFWDTRSGNYLGIKQDDYSYLLSVAFSPDSSTIAFGGRDGSIFLRNDESTKKLVAHQEWVRCLTFSPDGSLLASGGCDNAVRLWNAKTGEPVKSLTGMHSAVSSVDFTPDGKELVSGQADGTITSWDVKNFALKQTISGLVPPVKAITISPDGRTIAIDGRWVRRAEQQLGELKIIHIGNSDADVVLSTEPVWNRSLSYSPDGRFLASAAKPGVINIWDTSTGRIEMTIPGSAPAVFSPDGRTLAVGSQSRDLTHTLDMWDMKTGELKHTLVAYHHDEITKSSYPESITTAAFSKDREMIAMGHHCFVATLWNAHTGELLHELAWHSYSDTVSALAFSPDGKTLAIGVAYDNDVHLWSTRTGKEKRMLVSHANNIESLAYSPDGKVLASASADGTVKLWHSLSGRLLATLLRLQSDEKAEWIAYTPEGYYNGSEGIERFIRWKSGSQLLPGDAYADKFRQSSF